MPYRLAMSPCSDSYGNRTRVTAVKGRCLNRLTKEPYFIFLKGLYLQNYTLNMQTLDCSNLTSKPASLSSGHLVTSSLDVLLVANVFAPNLPVCSLRSSISKLISDRPSRLSAFKSAFSAFGQVLDRLVTVSSTRYRASTSALSTSSSSRGLTNLRYGISYLEGGFTLRCLQRLSRPDLATRLCFW